jgi:hypothetical protein
LLGWCGFFPFKERCESAVSQSFAESFFNKS